MSTKFDRRMQIIVDMITKREYRFVMGTLTRTQVVDLLRKWKGKKSLRVFGREIGVTAAYLSDVFRGNREPGPTILNLLGIERTKTTETTYEKKRP